MSNNHRAEVYTTLEQLLKETECLPKENEDNASKKRRRYWTKKWKKHIEKHGNVPMIFKCSICSGKEQKNDIKHGTWKVDRPTKTERDENKGVI